MFGHLVVCNFLHLAAQSPMTGYEDLAHAPNETRCF